MQHLFHHPKLGKPSYQLWSCIVYLVFNIIWITKASIYHWLCHEHLRRNKHQRQTVLFDLETTYLLILYESYLLINVIPCLCVSSFVCPNQIIFVHSLWSYIFFLMFDNCRSLPLELQVFDSIGCYWRLIWQLTHAPPWPCHSPWGQVAVLPRSHPALPLPLIMWYLAWSKDF